MKRCVPDWRIWRKSEVDMNCLLETREDTQVLLDYCARALPTERVELVETHIQSCPRCQEFAAAQQALSETLDLWQPPPVSQDFNRRLYQRIDADSAHSSWWKWKSLAPGFFAPGFLAPGFFAPSLFRRGLPVAAAACLLVTIGIVLERPAHSPIPPAKDMAQIESVQPEQVEQALDTMDLLSEFSHHVRTDGGESKL
jgi:anti-sigma factor RsiW